MLAYAIEQIRLLEKSVELGDTRDLVFKKLRKLGLTDFGNLFISLPDPTLPKLSTLLPKMASEEVQNNWTGSSGVTLLKQTLDFVRAAAYNYTRITGDTLDGKRILDYGCGYGRISRLMYYFTNEKNLYGVDPWDKSIAICREDGFGDNFRQSDYLPTKLPVDEVRFDLIFAFSVFTHLSKRATLTCLNTISDYLQPDGVLLITIRPVEYWNFDKHSSEQRISDQLQKNHEDEGFAFLPHNRPAIDGDITYGDTSMTTEWITTNFPSLKIVGIDRSLSDAYQLYVFLQKR
jgi:SAM-dependent methyltransferase